MAVVLVTARRYPGHVVMAVEQTATDQLRDLMWREVAEHLVDHVMKYGMPKGRGVVGSNRGVISPSP